MADQLNPNKGLFCTLDDEQFSRLTLDISYADGLIEAARSRGDDSDNVLTTTLDLARERLRKISEDLGAAFDASQPKDGGEHG